MKDYFIAEMENYISLVKGKEVIVLGCDPKLITAPRIEESIHEAPRKIFRKRGYIALQDVHPEQVDDLIFNQGEYAIV